MRLALVVPALNEEEAIAATLRRVLDARAKVVAETDVTEMIVVFVNDGSTDRTQEIVDQPEFDEVVKVRFEHNRGYGAAIKAGWEATDAELVGFIDGDGTCDPEFCVKLVNRLQETNADAVLAGRLTPESEMPLIRKIGNVIFARLLGLVSGKDLTDSASGFRIVRRSSLKLMCPLPDGLHFTPAMSCICLLDPRLRIEEVPMHYKERIGRSKLSVIKDGFRFLYTILFSACCYAPLKTMIGASTIVGGLWAALLWALFLLTGSLDGTSIIMGLAAGLVVLMLVATGIVVHQLNDLMIGPRRDADLTEQFLQWGLHYRRLITGGSIVGALGFGLLTALVITQPITSNTSLVGAILTMLIFLVGVGSVVMGVIVRVIWAVSEKQKALIADQQKQQAAAATATPPPNPPAQTQQVQDTQQTQPDDAPQPIASGH